MVRRLPGLGSTASWSRELPHGHHTGLAGVGGFEPPRCSLTGKCSAAELHAKAGKARIELASPQGGTCGALPKRLPCVPRWAVADNLG